MDLELINKLSGLVFHGFHDPSKNMVTVHFFNELEPNKPDIIAYLCANMAWDVREITKEESALYADREEIVIHHSPIGVYGRDSNFDKFIRAGLEELGKQTHGEDAVLEEKDKMFRILKANSYGEN